MKRSLIVIVLVAAISCKKEVDNNQGNGGSNSQEPIYIDRVVPGGDTTDPGQTPNNPNGTLPPYKFYVQVEGDQEWHLPQNITADSYLYVAIEPLWAPTNRVGNYTIQHTYLLFQSSIEVNGFTRSSNILRVCQKAGMDFSAYVGNGNVNIRAYNFLSDFYCRTSTQYPPYTPQPHTCPVGQVFENALVAFNVYVFTDSTQRYEDWLYNNQATCN